MALKQKLIANTTGTTLKGTGHITEGILRTSVGVPTGDPLNSGMGGYRLAEGIIERKRGQEHHKTADEKEKQAKKARFWQR